MKRKPHVTVTTAMRREMRLRRPKETYDAIGFDLGVSPATVRYHTRDLPRRPYPAPEFFPIDRAVALLRMGCTRKEAARRLSVSVPTLYKRLKEAGVRSYARFSDVTPRKIAA